jgi:hypothetical protein
LNLDCFCASSDRVLRVPQSHRFCQIKTPLLACLSSTDTTLFITLINHLWTAELSSFPNTLTTTVMSFATGPIRRALSMSASTARPLQIPQLPATSHATLSYTKPLTSAALEHIRRDLAKHVQEQEHQWPAVNENETHAAVLIPLCNVHGRPGILLEVRGGNLRSHSGEVRCVFCASWSFRNTHASPPQQLSWRTCG